jgi:glycerol uptake facilitator-like aquaporin
LRRVVTNATHQNTLGSVGVSLVFGLVIMVMIYATGHLSGAHINPAVTIAFTLTRHFPGRDAIAYIGAQIAGAVAGAFLLLAAWPSKPANLGRPCRRFRRGRHCSTRSCARRS